MAQIQEMLEAYKNEVAKLQAEKDSLITTHTTEINEEIKKMCAEFETTVQAKAVAKVCGDESARLDSEIEKKNKCINLLETIGTDDSLFATMQEIVNNTASNKKTETEKVTEPEKAEELKEEVEVAPTQTTTVTTTTSSPFSMFKPVK